MEVNGRERKREREVERIVDEEEKVKGLRKCVNVSGKKKVKRKEKKRKNKKQKERNRK